MAYTPHTWVAGETITPARLNNIETGIVSAGGTVYYYDVKYDDVDWTDNEYPDLAEIIGHLEEGAHVWIRVLTKSTDYAENNNYGKAVSWMDDGYNYSVSYYNTYNNYIDYMYVSKSGDLDAI